MAPPQKISGFPIPDQDLILYQYSFYDQIELISALAGLQIYSKNHSNVKRLAIAIQIAGSIKKGGKNKIKGSDLQQILHRFFPAKGSLSIYYEDPPEDLLTENIDFVNGNNIVYSGFFADGGHILQTILRSLPATQNELPEDFVNTKFILPALALLLLSNEVAKRAGHPRYLVSKVQLWGEIEIPEKEELIRLQRSVVFSSEDIRCLFSPFGLDETIIEPFITRIGASDLLKGEVFDNPLFYRPLIKIDNMIILAIPAAIVGTIRHNLIMTVKKERKIRQLISAITASYWRETEINLQLLQFGTTDLVLPESEKIEGFMEGIYELDSDKIAYVQLIVDNANSFEQIYPLNLWSEQKRMTATNRRYEEIISWLLKQKDPRCQNIFYLLIFGSIGRSIHFKHTPSRNNVTDFGLTSENLEILARLGDCDCLQLWKFVRHFEEVSSYHSMRAFSTLDKYEFYLRTHVPREDWQGEGGAIIIIDSGSGQRLRIDATKKRDIHAVQSVNPPAWVIVTHDSEDPSDPVYVPDGSMNHSLDHVIEMYSQPIWIQAKPRSGRIFLPNFTAYHHFVSVFSFWLWQLTESLHHHLVPLGSDPIHIGIDFKKFLDNELINQEEEGPLRSPAISIDKKNRTITLEINGTIFSAIDQNDNSGERCLVDTLLQALGKFLIENGFPNTLDTTTRNKILEHHIPYGTKRKMYPINTGKNASFDPRWIPPPRLLQDHDIIEQMSGLKTDFENFLITSGISIDKQNPATVFDSCVDIYLHRLKKAVSEYSWIEILSEFICRHEALLNYFTVLDHNIPSSISLFSDLETEVNNVISKRTLHDNTSLAVRTLIEILAAEPPHGNKKMVSITNFDSLLALSHHFAHLGVQGDTLYYNLFSLAQSEEKDSIDFPEGESPRDRVENFFKNKYHEGIKAKLEEFNEIPQRDTEERKVSEADFKEEWQQAFKAEFGLTQTQILRFFVCATDLGFELESSAPHLPLSEFKKRIQSRLQWSDSDLNQAIAQFSLVPRPQYEIAPHGYEAEKDIFPWIYNRRISYLIRPLIIGPEPAGDPFVIWGPRHVDAARRLLMDNVFSGRYLREDKTTPEMKAFISRMQNESSKSFENEVKEWFVKNTPWIIDHAVFISPNGKIHNEINLGDIDVLAIDTSSKKIFSIECKHFHFGRNPREIAREIRKILGNEGDTSSAMAKHSKRDAWLKSHMHEIRSAYGLPEADYILKSLFIVSEVLQIQYLRETPLPIVAFSQVKNEGLNLFHS